MSTTKGMEADYKDHSHMQLAAIDSTSTYVRRAIQALNIVHVNLVLICDFGCAHGSNSVHAIQSIIQTLKTMQKLNEQEQRILAIHNDLPTNNWTSIFDHFPTDGSYFGVASGKSFYEQCLPSNSVAIGYSSAALHWLSCKPCNLTNRCLIDINRDDSETNAFRTQAALDYSHFLRHRAEELMPGGVLILSIMGDQSGRDTRHHADILYRCAEKLLSSDELLDFTFPMYFRTYNECVDEKLFSQYGLELIEADWVTVQSPLVQELKDGKITLDEVAHVVTKAVRSACEFPLKQAIVKSGQRSLEEVAKLLDDYWQLHEDAVKEQQEMLDEDLMCINIVLRKVKRTQ